MWTWMFIHVHLRMHLISVALDWVLRRRVDHSRQTVSASETLFLETVRDMFIQNDMYPNKQ